MHDEIRLLNEALVGSASASDELAARIRLLTEGNACVALPTIDAVECASLASGVATFGLQTVVEELLRRSNSQLAVWEMQPSWEASRSVLLSADAAATRDLEARVLAPGLLAVEELFLQWAVDRADRAEDLILGLLIALLILTLVLEVCLALSGGERSSSSVHAPRADTSRPLTLTLVNRSRCSLAGASVWRQSSAGRCSPSPLCLRSSKSRYDAIDGGLRSGRTAQPNPRVRPHLLNCTGAPRA